MSAAVLVLGFGNPGRQDDGLGPAAAAQLEQLGWSGVTVNDNYQLVIEDTLELIRHDVVWFVDASRTAAAPYEVSPVAPASHIAFTSHSVKPQVLLAMALNYYGRAPEAYLLGIRGYEFEFVEGLTRAAQANLAQALELLQERIARQLERCA